MKENIDTEWKLHLLTIIARNGNVNELLYGDYDLQYLLRQLRVFVEEGLVARVENSYRITQKGEELSCSIRNTLHYKGINRFVLPDRRFSIDTLSVEDIYIPKKKMKK
jgi:DNA-binding HxlR family transcriptional regulator